MLDFPGTAFVAQQSDAVDERGEKRDHYIFLGILPQTQECFLPSHQQNPTMIGATVLTTCSNRPIQALRFFLLPPGMPKTENSICIQPHASLNPTCTTCRYLQKTKALLDLTQHPLSFSPRELKKVQLSTSRALQLLETAVADVVLKESPVK